MARRRRGAQSSLGTEGARRASGGPSEPAQDDRGRFSARRKTEAVLRLLRGEDLDTLSRELGVTAATLSRWREQFLASAQAGFKSRPSEDRADEVKSLRAKLGELIMDNEVLREGLRLRGAETPFVPGRRKP